MAKDKVAPPIDRPLGRAYLRKFTGWSTAYPPGMSEPTSLRTMHNCSVTADGALRIRPGLRRVLDVPADGDIVGTFEHFYLLREDGTAYKALLFAVRESDDSVGFRVASDPNNTGHMQVQNLTEVFEYPPGQDPNFHRGTQFSDLSYVKYVQIDNKILAMSDNEEPFRLFQVGLAKPKMSVIRKIERPEYTLGDRGPGIIHRVQQHDR